MGQYLIVDHRVLFSHKQQAGWVSWEEFSSPDFIKEAPVSVLLTETEFRKSKTVFDGEKAERIDPLSIFPTHMTVQEEPLKNGVRQYAGVRSDHLKEVLNIFPRGSVKVCIPYVLALRAFLITKGLLKEKELRVVIEDIEEMILITLFEGMVVVATRMLSGVSEFELVEELVRSLKRADLSSNERAQFVCNKEEISALLVKEGLASHEQVIVIETARMAFDALDRATFGMNFLLPEEVARQKRQERGHRFLKVCGTAAGIVLMSVLYAVFGGYIKKEAVVRERIATSERQRSEKALEETSVKVFQTVLGQRSKVGLEELFQAVLMNAPGGWRLEKLVLRKQELLRTIIEGTFSGTENGVFACEGVFQKCRMHTFFVSGRSWSVVTAESVSKAVQQGEQ